MTAYGGDYRFFNRYAYGFNNPYKFTDPDGRNPALKLVVDFAIEAGIQYATTGTVDVGVAASETLKGALNPMKTVERARDLAKIVKGAGKASDTASSTARKQAGSYTNTHESGKTYDGKGSQKRSQVSGQRVEKETGDKHVATDWTPASSGRDAFKQESQRLDSHGGPTSASNHNKIESPGKKMRDEDLRR